MKQRRSVLRESGFAPDQKPANSLGYPPPGLEQRYPQHCPAPDPLGTPLSIREVADVIGCSPWTIRQRYLPAGLPHHRLTPNGKLIFYKSQIIRWLLARQQKGGKFS